MINEQIVYPPQISRRAVIPWLIGVMLGAFFLPAVYSAQALAEPTISKLQLESAYLYNFLLFAHWPEEGQASQQTTMTVCILGDEALAEQFAPVAGKAIKDSQYTLRIKAIRPPLQATDLEGCVLLFIGQQAQVSVPEVLAQVKGQPILTVSNLPNFAAQGGMLALLEVDGKLRWQVNQAVTEANGLRLDAQLLRNATAVIKSGEGH